MLEFSSSSLYWDSLSLSLIFRYAFIFALGDVMIVTFVKFALPRDDVAVELFGYYFFGWLSSK